MNNPNPPARNYHTNAGSGFGQNGADSVQCGCGQNAKELTVQKEGPNKGRPFYACPKPRGEGCKFFQWGDEAGAPPQNQGGFGGGRGRGRGHQRPRTSDSGDEPGPKQRKQRCCGICHQPGHTRQKCPQNR